MGSVLELRETVQEHVTFTNWDILWGLGVTHQGATNQKPWTILFSQVLSLPVGKQGFVEVTTNTASPIVADMDMARCTAPPSGMERENRYLLVVTAYVEQLNLGPSCINPKQSVTDLPRGNTFQNPKVAAIFSVLTRAASYGGATVKE